MSQQPDLADPLVARALSNPRRHALLAELTTPATTSQLSVRLSMNKGSVSHHMRILLESGLVRRASSRTVRGGTEVYFERTMAHWILPNKSPAASAATADILDALGADPTAHVHQRTPNLTAHQAHQLALHLDQFIETLEPAKAPAPLHSVMIAVYSRAPGPRSSSM